jgi:transcription-repair coupling factor (superfamily II helicase)
MLQPQVAGLADLRPVRLTTGDDYEMGDLAADLVAAAYQRVDLVERRGEFAMRGGIVDIFPPTEEHPVRIDFFGDQIDSITTSMSPISVLPTNRFGRIIAVPAANC